MPKLRLYRIDRRRKEGPWQFYFDGDGVMLISDDNQPVAYFPHEMAENRIILPSFFGNIEHLGIVGDDGKTIWFARQSESLARIGAYLNWTVAIQGPEPIKRLKTQAKRSWYLGIGFMAAGLLAFPLGGLDSCSFHLIWFPALIALAHALTTQKKIKEIHKIQDSLGNESSDSG
jgi:hypothetical protein